MRTRLVNHVRSTLKGSGDRVMGTGTSTFGRRAARQIPKELRSALAPVLRTIADLKTRIKDHERRIEGLCRDQYPETALLRQVSGVGAVTALSFVLILDDPLRFSSSRAVGAFLGLIPRQSQSGDHDPQLRISKAGNREQRRALVQSAQYTLGSFARDSTLRRFGEDIAARGGKVAKHRAVIAVARKLSGLLHRLWGTGEVYEPLRNAERARSKTRVSGLTSDSTRSSERRARIRTRR